MDIAYDEDDLLPISALQHLMFCERQWGLIHIEQLWVENRLTAEGRGLHEKVHKDEAEARKGIRLVRGLMVRSFQLGLIGKTDVVEFHRIEDKDQTVCDPNDTPYTVAFKGIAGRWKPIPVEYKRGRPKTNHCDETQLCAQALCLEEMLGISIEQGFLFYGRPRRRTDVLFGNDLRNRTQSAIHRLHELTRQGKTPSAAYGPKCKNCSLIEVCLPKTLGQHRSAQSYLQRSIDGAIGET